MILPPRSLNEAGRLEVLRRYDLLDTSPEQALDDLALLTAHVCEAPISLISLIDEKRQWFKSRVGFSGSETSRDISFCAHAILQPDLFIVPEATKDERFAGNPLVTGDSHVRFYAGAPLITREGQAIGTLCVLDREPRQLDVAQREALRVLGRQVMSQLELRRQTRELAASEERLRIVTDNAQVGLAMVNRERRYVYANRAYAKILGLTSSSIVGQRVEEVLAGLYEEQIRPHLDRAFAGECTAYELHRPGGGSDYHYAIRYEPAEEVDGSVEMVVTVITDITERKAAVAESERQHAEIQLILNTVPALVFYKDREGRFLCVNHELAQLLGAPQETFLGKTDAEMGSPDADHYRTDDLRVMTTGEPLRHLEEKLQTPDGVRWVLTDKVPHRDEAGNIIGVIGFAVDITARKQAEEALREAVRFAQSTIDALSAHLCVLDEKGTILATNEAWRRFAEANPSSHQSADTGKNYLQICDVASGAEAADAAAFAAGIRALLRGEQTDFTMEYPCHSPSEKRWFVGRVTRFPGDGPVRVVVAHEDVTERKRNEEQLAEQAALLDKAQDAILVRDLEGEILFWNKGAERMYGWMSHEVVGRNIGELLYADPKAFEKVNGLAVNQGEWHGELWHLTRDRGEISVEARWTLVRDHEGNPKSVLAISRTTLTSLTGV